MTKAAGTGSHTGTGVQAKEGAGCSAAGAGGEDARAVSGVEPIADASGWDSAYYVPKYASFDEARLASEEIAREVEASDIVLLKNDGVLPLAADEHVSLLGRGAAEPVLGGTGAALIDKTHAVDALGARRALLGKRPRL